MLKVLIIEHPSDNTKIELKRASDRLVEQERGDYQFKKLHMEAKSLRLPHLDHATYIGPIEVKTSGSKGRGLFTTAAVKAGDLLLCEKAFAHAFFDHTDAGSGTELVLTINMEKGTMSKGTQSELINTIVQKLFRNPSLDSIITDLHHGSYEKVDVSSIDGSPVVDS